MAEKPPSVLTWLTYPNVLQSMPVPVDVDGLQEGILDAVSQACEMLVAMRGREGARMGADLSAKANALEERIAQMEQLADRLHHELHDKLLRRLRDLVDAVDESRLLTEVALLAERSTVDEELVRLRSHLSEFMSLLAAGSPVGRRLDFIVQEMHREVNTIGSKATDARLSSLVIDAKTLVEQLREQVQNIE
ncbi:hypothetical protein GCM10025857_04800 [Alicyclobacillus contaminans]|nr:hypothetical protein GCM10025857_04800 [Alicyclobacillus contaminans]